LKRAGVKFEYLGVFENITSQVVVLAVANLDEKPVRKTRKGTVESLATVEEMLRGDCLGTFERVTGPDAARLVGAAVDALPESLPNGDRKASPSHGWILAEDAPPARTGEDIAQRLRDDGIQAHARRTDFATDVRPTWELSIAAIDGESFERSTVRVELCKSTAEAKSVASERGRGSFSWRRFAFEGTEAEHLTRIRCTLTRKLYAVLRWASSLVGFDSAEGFLRHLDAGRRNDYGPAGSIELRRSDAADTGPAVTRAVVCIDTDDVREQLYAHFGGPELDDTEGYTLPSSMAGPPVEHARASSYEDVPL
jgi:hypothetical protein